MNYEALEKKYFVNANYASKPEAFHSVRTGRVLKYLGEQRTAIGSIEHVFLVSYRIETHNDILLPQEVVTFGNPSWTFADTMEDVDEFVTDALKRQGK